jgi:hypothetical protein
VFMKVVLRATVQTCWQTYPSRLVFIDGAY